MCLRSRGSACQSRGHPRCCARWRARDGDNWGSLNWQGQYLERRNWKEAATCCQQTLGSGNDSPISAFVSCWLGDLDTLPHYKSKTKSVESRAALQWLTRGLKQLSLESVATFQLALQQELVQVTIALCELFAQWKVQYEKKESLLLFITLDWLCKEPAKIMCFQPAKKTLQESEDWDKQIFPFPDY